MGFISRVNAIFGRVNLPICWFEKEIETKLIKGFSAQLKQMIPLR
jgi:hypothetical protein